MEGNNYKKGLWTEEEDKILMDYVYVHGKGRWNRISKTTGLKRCGKSCRLRWINYLSPNVNRGDFTEEEEDLIIRLHNLLGNRWSLIAGRVPGRTDNQVKNHWNSHLSKKLRMKKDRENASDSSVSLPEEGQGENLKLQQEATSSNTDNPSPHGDCGSLGPKLKDSPDRTGSGSDLLEDSQGRTGSGLNLLEDRPERTGSGLDLLESLANDDLSSSFWFYNEDFYLNSTPGLVDFLYGSPLDVVWHNF